MSVLGQEREENIHGVSSEGSLRSIPGTRRVECATKVRIGEMSAIVEMAKRVIQELRIESLFVFLYSASSYTSSPFWEAPFSNNVFVWDWRRRRVAVVVAQQSPQTGASFVLLFSTVRSIAGVGVGT